MALASNLKVGSLSAKMMVEHRAAFELVSCVCVCVYVAAFLQVENLTDQEQPVMTVAN